MRDTLQVMTAAAVLGMSAVLVTACWPFNQLEDCDLNPNLPCYWAGKAASAGSGGDGGTPPGCVPSQNQTPVSNACGVFVSVKGDDGAARRSR
jgi:hypothetical protein